ncbi:diguanylate cyclase [Pseudoxanthomonas sp. SL93]|uniref:ligand-binding sensor domain-containing diguanylate cyclase n=1 Tax=Pseudoxanthomonas sp. SL93 TaxID=2995142 RepID=UPI0022722BDF|nr:ligand-binding sensor domain-containing diguanylate cyclase [Pseudoxanthomonas sp. SL93]WAC63155.1 diguanylate cyclase [Pseudoxanthomonas sp. SL93]
MAALCPTAHALDPSKSFHHYVRNSWNLEQGLPQLSVIAIAQDRPGYLWFGTQAGLSRFDGVRFTNFDLDNTPGLPSTWIQALQSDRQGRLWIGTPQGLAVRRGNQVTAVPLAAGEAAGVVDVRALQLDAQGRVLAATDRGVMIVEADALRTLHAMDEGGALSLRVDEAEQLWVGGRGRVHVFGGREARALRLPAGAEAATVTSLARHDGRWWAGGDTGLYVLEGDHWRPQADVPATNGGVQALHEDRDGILWASTKDTLYRMRGGRLMERIGASGALAEIRVFYEDRESNLWLGSNSEGASRVWNGWTRRFSRAEGLAQPLLWSIAQDPQGRTWVGSDDGVSVFEGGRFRSVAQGKDLPHPAAYTLLAEQDQTWIGTRDGAALYRDGRVQRPGFLAPMDAAQINGMLRDQQKRLWFATSKGLFRWDGGERLRHYAGEAGLQDIRVRVLMETRDGRLLVGTQSGLYEFIDERLQRIPLTGSGLEAPHIVALHELAGGQWVAGALSEEVMLLFNGQRWTRLDKRRGIPANAPFFFAEEDDGFLWVGGLRGIYRVAVADVLMAAEDPAFRIEARTLLNERGDRHGGQKGDCCNGAGNSRGFLVDHALWLPTRDGVVVMETDQDLANDYLPESVIERVQVSGQWRAADTAADWSLPSTTRDLRFEFTTLSFQAADHIDIRYRLDGYDTDWKLLDDPHQRSATYTNLPAGEYVFEVIGTNNSGLSSRVSARLPFSIAPRFFESAWFYALLGLVLAGLVMLWNRWLLRRHTRQRTVLEKLVQQRTVDLQQANQRLQAISLTDPLTGLHNRRYLAQQLPIDIAYYQRHRGFAAGADVLAFALLDIDHFKSINDSHGHQAGDRVLQAIAHRLRTLAREGDYVIRWGGEEFLLVFRPMPRHELHAMGRRICTTIACTPVETGQETLKVTASLGLIGYPPFPQAPDLLGWEQLVSLADRALYQVKADGRNGWAHYALGTAPLPDLGEDTLRRDPAELVRAGCLQLHGPHHPGQ